jgi:hypothetical protein
MKMIDEPSFSVSHIKSCHPYQIIFFSLLCVLIFVTFPLFIYMDHFKRIVDSIPLSSAIPIPKEHQQVYKLNLLLNSIGTNMSCISYEFEYSHFAGGLNGVINPKFTPNVVVELEKELFSGTGTSGIRAFLRRWNITVQEVSCFFIYYYSWFS